MIGPGTGTGKITDHGSAKPGGPAFSEGWTVTTGLGRPSRKSSSSTPEEKLDDQNQQQKGK